MNTLKKDQVYVYIIIYKTRIIPFVAMSSPPTPITLQNVLCELAQERFPRLYRNPFLEIGTHNSLLFHFALRCYTIRQISYCNQE